MLTEFISWKVTILLISRIPAPRPPPLNIFPLIIGSSISIAIVSFAINISMAKLFAKKYKYELDANQVAFVWVKVDKVDIVNLIDSLLL